MLDSYNSNKKVAVLLRVSWSPAPTMKTSMATMCIMPCCEHIDLGCRQGATHDGACLKSAAYLTVARSICKWYPTTSGGSVCRTA
jgi:hypothetical protein